MEGVSTVTIFQTTDEEDNAACSSQLLSIYTQPSSPASSSADCQSTATSGLKRRERSYTADTEHGLSIRLKRNEYMRQQVERARREKKAIEEEMHLEAEMRKYGLSLPPS